MRSREVGRDPMPRKVCERKIETPVSLNRAGAVHVGRTLPPFVTVGHERFKRPLRRRQIATPGRVRNRPHWRACIGVTNEAGRTTSPVEITATTATRQRISSTVQFAATDEQPRQTPRYREISDCCVQRRAAHPPGSWWERQR